MRWNLSSRARDLSKADAVILSIPKSGRTWVRTFLSSYFAAKSGCEFSINLTNQRARGVPRLVYSHDRFENRTKGSFWDRLRGKYLVPNEQVRNAPLVILVRDPRDAFVSYFVQQTRRNPAAPASIRGKSADDLLSHRRYGIAAMVATLNQWMREFGHRSDFHLVRYEDLRRDGKKSFRDLLLAIGEKEINAAAFEGALHFAEFDNMQQLEARGAFGDKILAPRDAGDPESFKVRKGKVGGFGDYLSPEGQRLATESCAQLDSRFGYGT